MGLNGPVFGSQRQQTLLSWSLSLKQYLPSTQHSVQWVSYGFFLRVNGWCVQLSPYLRLTPKINLLTPNVNCSGRTAPLISIVAFYIFIQQI